MLILLNIWRNKIIKLNNKFEVKICIKLSTPRKMYLKDFFKFIINISSFYTTLSLPVASGSDNWTFI